MYATTYNSLFELMIDVIHDSERGLPVEIICKSKDMKGILSYILPESSFNISYLSFNSYEHEHPEDITISICLSCREITICELMINNGIISESGEGHIRYVSSECDERFLKNDACISIIKYIMEDKDNG